MQELFVDKTYFFKFLSMRGKPPLHQLKIITSTRSTVQASLAIWIFPAVRENTIKEGKISCVTTTTSNHYKASPTCQHAKILYSIVSLVFRKFLCNTYQNGLNRVPQSWGTPSTLKSTNRVSLILVVGNLNLRILLHRVRYLKNLMWCLENNRWCLENNRSSFFWESLKSETKDMHP